MFWLALLPLVPVALVVVGSLLSQTSVAKFIVHDLLRPVVIFWIRTQQHIFCSIFGQRWYTRSVKYVECTLIGICADVISFPTITKDGAGFYHSRSHGASSSNGTVFYIHGGGFCVHTATEKLVAKEILKLYKQPQLYFCDYSLCPSVGVQEIFDQCWEQYKKVHALCDGNVIIMGDSAGGNLVLQIKLHTQETSSYAPKGAVLLSPWINVKGETSFPSCETNASTDYMSYTFLAAFRALTTEGSKSVESLDSILQRSTSLKDTLIVSGGGELLTDESVALWLAAGGSSGSCEIYLGDEAPHDFMMSPIFCKAGVFEEAWRVIATRLKVFFEDYEEEEGEDGWVEVNLDDDEDIVIEDDADEDADDYVDEEPDELGYEHIKKYVDAVLKKKKKKKKKATSKKSTPKQSTPKQSTPKQSTPKKTRSPSFTTTRKRRSTSRKRSTK